MLPPLILSPTLANSILMTALVTGFVQGILAPDAPNPTWPHATTIPFSSVHLGKPFASISSTHPLSLLLPCYLPHQPDSCARLAQGSALSK